MADPKSPAKTPESNQNVLPFPNRRKAADTVEESAKSATPDFGPAPKAAVAVAASARRPLPKGIIGGTVAVLLATVAVNRFVYRTSAKEGEGTPGRAIASVGSTQELTRDPVWEKALAESLASVRGIASVQVGRGPTLEEKLRWGTLEEKYDLTFTGPTMPRELRGITWRGASSGAPLEMPDRAKFIHEYGPLFNADAGRAISTEKSLDKSVETFELVGENLSGRRIVRFELDNQMRLLSMSVEPNPH